MTQRQLETLLGLGAIFLDAIAAEAADAELQLKGLTKALGDLLMGEVARALAAQQVARHAHVVLVSQFGLSALPLHAAHDGSPPNVFLETYELECVPSIMLLAPWRARQRRPPPEPSRVLLVVDPSEDLPYSHLEARLISDVLADYECVKLEGSEATAQEVVDAAGEATHLHFACHGYFDVTAPWQSGLEMADEDLSAAEVALSGENGHTDLVVLSACETGVTDVRRSPNEYGGLPAAFIISGAEAVVTSLWSVADWSTAILMAEFYRRAASAGENVASALRGAQLWLRSVTAGELLAWLDAQPKGRPRLRFMRLQPDDVLRDLIRDLNDRDPASRPFETADHWAAFVALSSIKPHEPAETRSGFLEV
jgi:CHAT domain-containing protein